MSLMRQDYCWLRITDLSIPSLFLLLFFLSVTSIVPIVFHFTLGYKYAQYIGQETLAKKMTDT